MFYIPTQQPIVFLTFKEMGEGSFKALFCNFREIRIQTILVVLVEARSHFRKLHFKTKENEDHEL